MTGIRKNLWNYLTDENFRREYKAEHARSGIAYQIRAMRDARGWSQSDLAKKAGKSQSNIARLEDPDYGKFSVQTLLEIADAFDVWLSVEFVSFKTGLARTANRSPSILNAEPFSVHDINELKPDTKSTTTAIRTNLNQTPPRRTSMLNCFRWFGPEPAIGGNSAGSYNQAGLFVQHFSKSAQTGGSDFTPIASELDAA